jgi:hypothetical protein
MFCSLESTFATAKRSSTFWWPWLHLGILIPESNPSCLLCLVLARPKNKNRISGKELRPMIRRLFFTLLLTLASLLALASMANAITLLNIAITTPIVQTTGTVFQIRPGPGGQFLPATLTLQCNMTFGSGGTAIDADLQTSIDGGVTWVDIANCNYPSVIAASKRMVWTLQSSLIAAPVQTVPTDGTLGANTAISGIYGTLFRVKYQSTGTFVATTLRIDLIANGITSLP